jgi:hypothetical protein
LIPSPGANVQGVTGFDRAVEALSHSDRRRVLVAVHDNGSQNGDVGVRVEGTLPAGAGTERSEGQVEIGLVHRHLPKLEALGYIRWNRERSEIRQGPNWGEIAPLLGLLRSHPDELPDGWL